MARLGFGFGQPRRQAVSGQNFILSQSISLAGVTFSFSTMHPAGQYANGDWWVVGPVAITSITPSSTVQTSGTDGNGTAITSRVVHGAVVNPGNRVYATGGLPANNAGFGATARQGYDSITSGGGIPFIAFQGSLNVDPGATGVPLSVATGSVVKFVSRLTGLPSQNRPAGLDQVVLTVVDSIPTSDAIRPGVSRASKVTQIRRSQFDLSRFNNFPPTPSAPTFAEALDWVDRYIESSITDGVNNPCHKAINNHPEYGRDIGNNLHRSLLALHLNFTAAQKLTLLSAMASIADDIVSRREEGGLQPNDGGGNQYRKSIVVVCAAALGSNVPTSWLTWLAAVNNPGWGEDNQLFTVSGFDIALPRHTADGRPRSAYSYQMLGSTEWGVNPTGFAEGNGSNWNAFYRDIVAGQLLGGALAVELTTGAKALWDNPGFWRYMDCAWHRRAEFSSGNTTVPFTEEMLATYRPAKTATPALLASGIKDRAIWLRYDQALNETTTPPATSAFTVNVNGAPVAVSSVSIWRQNIGLTLAAPVTGNDTVTVSYTLPGTSQARSVDGVNVGAISAQQLSNISDKVGGPNTAFPVVQFTPGVARTIITNGSLGAANTSFGTLALLKYRFETAPATNTQIFGNVVGVPTVQLFQNVNRTLELRVYNAAGSLIIRIGTPALTAGVDNDILFSFDTTQASGVNGVNCFVNEVAQTLTFATWSGGAGATLGWARNWPMVVNPGAGTSFRIGAIWLDTNTRVDLTSAGNRAKFTGVTGGNLEILTLGNGINGSQPSQFLVGNADQWNDGTGMNRGTGAKFFVTSGLVSLVSGSPWV